MKVIFLNEGVFGSYKNLKLDKDKKREALRKETEKIYRKAAREDIGKFYGKVLQIFAKNESKIFSQIPATKEIALTHNKTIYLNIEPIINIHSGWSNLNNKVAELSDYENIAKSIYGTTEFINSGGAECIIPIGMPYDNGLIDKSILNNRNICKDLSKHFSAIIDEVEKTQELPLGFVKPKSYKLLLLLQCHQSWGDNLSSLGDIYDLIYKGEFKGSIYDIIDVTYNKNTEHFRYINFFNSKETIPDGQISGGNDCVIMRSSKDIDKLVKVIPTIIQNGMYWNKVHINTNYKNLKEPEFFDFLHTLEKYNIPVKHLSFYDSMAYNKQTTNNNLVKGVERTIESIKLLKKLKEECPNVGSNIDVPANLCGGIAMISFDKKYLASSPGSTKNTHNITALGKNIGLNQPKGKFARNIYAIDVNSSGLKNDLIKIIKDSQKYQNKSDYYGIIDFSGKYESLVLSEIADQMIEAFKKLIYMRPHCALGDYLLFCSYTQGGESPLDEIIRIEYKSLEESRKKLTLFIKYDFKLACAQGFNPRYANTSGMNSAGKTYEYIAGKSIKVVIPTP